MKDRQTARTRAIDAAMKALYGTNGPDEDVDAAAVRTILGLVYDAGAGAGKP